MLVTHSIQETRAALESLGPVAFVPTMGALHQGHASLIQRARPLAQSVVVSIFVNPTQFAPDEDFNRYPRPLEKDLELCREAGADLVFHPPVQEIYPSGATERAVDVPALAQDMEGAIRPGHFQGVCRVVAKLLGIVRPATACFGMKDYQQLKVIQAMSADLFPGLKIEACPTFRDPDGLACSSRNVYLSPPQRVQALALHEALLEALKMVENGVRDTADLQKAMADRMGRSQVAVDYAQVRRADTLASCCRLDRALGAAVCLVAGRVGATRLIDNMVIEPSVLSGPP